jgi:hypothetical protein
MKHLLFFENFNSKHLNNNQTDDLTYQWTSGIPNSLGERIYLFDSENWQYKVSIIENIKNEKFPYVGFRAKKEDDYFYDMSIITNDSVYKVMKTIQNIIIYDINTYNNFGYTFSFTGDSKKSKQRLELYKKIFSNMFTIIYDNINNHYIVKKV